MQWILQNEIVVYCIMAVLIFGITQGLKWAFVKPWTNKIKNERVRKAVNTTIYFIPYALGILFELVYSVMLLHGEFNWFMGLIHGTSGIACYGIYERGYAIITGKSKKVDNPYEDTEEGIAVKQLVDSIILDGKVDEQDKDALKSFWDKVK